MTRDAAEFWTDDTSVIFTSFWGWAPHTWGTMGWTGEQGLTRRTNLLKELSDPLIAAIYVTKSSDQVELRGMVVGFYLMSHETGHRNEFTHPSLHDLTPEKWEYSLRALRAFSYVPERRIKATDFDPTLAGGSRALAVAKWGEVLTDRVKIAQLREAPWVESNVYFPPGEAAGVEEEFEEEAFEPLRGFTRAGPANKNGYVVSSSAQELKRQLYILRLDGITDAYLGRASNGKLIFKVGLSASPELRRLSLQSAMPDGAFHWQVHYHSGSADQEVGFSFRAAVAGENAMKMALFKNSDWLGGEFYLASESDIDTAWKLGRAAAHAFQKS